MTWSAALPWILAGALGASLVMLSLWIVQRRTGNAGIAGGWLGFAAPAVLPHLILRATGIPPTEEQALKSRGDDYRRYQRTTSPFVPWPPRRDS